MTLDQSSCYTFENNDNKNDNDNNSDESGSDESGSDESGSDESGSDKSGSDESDSEDSHFSSRTGASLPEGDEPYDSQDEGCTKVSAAWIAKQRAHKSKLAKQARRR